MYCACSGAFNATTEMICRNRHSTPTNKNASEFENDRNTHSYSRRLNYTRIIGQLGVCYYKIVHSNYNHPIRLSSYEKTIICALMALLKSFNMFIDDEFTYHLPHKMFFS